MQQQKKEPAESGMENETSNDQLTFNLEIFAKWCLLMTDTGELTYPGDDMP